MAMLGIPNYRRYVNQFTAEPHWGLGTTQLAVRAVQLSNHSATLRPYIKKQVIKR